MDRYICIHGHFYQPPRENPWLEAVETQDSAHPYHDWNERITIECYEPNSTARILDDRDQIQRIVNNYASISFNFGATLMSWLETRSHHTYDQVVEADRFSREKFGGHSCAIAQAYNHIILPLASDRDKRTQVRWGIRDYQFRFGNDPEGMWLPETAVDIASLEALAAEGIVFTILEPHQALRYRKLGEEKWIEANGALDPTRAYRCTLPSGNVINLFFYDGLISRAVAFEQLLARGENLAHRLAGAFSDARKHAQLVNIATDGETYGHHHPRGEMALAYALHYIEANGLARITNYGEFLELHPPAYEVEIVERTAWSCAHGVERWRSDCGCNTSGAGWHQRWRTPLREALDWLRDETAAIFEKHGAAVLRDPWEARDDYIDVILSRAESTLHNFVAKHSVEGGFSLPHESDGRLKPAPTQNLTQILDLMEMQRNAMLMYTSCGWFFNDISGIETVQVLHYAARVIQLAERVSGESLEAQFMSRLRHAESNLPDRGTAFDIYDRDVIPTRLDLRRVAAHYAVASLFDSFDSHDHIYCYDVIRNDFEIEKAGRARLALGAITVRSTVTLEEERFDFAVLHLGETELTGGVTAARSAEEYELVKKELLLEMQPGGIPGIIRLLDTYFAETTLSIRSLFRDEQRRIFNMLCNATLEEAESAFRQLHERYDPLMRFHARLGIPIPKVLQMAAEFDLNVQLRKLLEQEDPPLSEIEVRIREAQDERVTLDETTLLSIKQAIETACDSFLEQPDDVGRLETFASLVTLVRASHLAVDLRRPQNSYYVMKGLVRPAIASDGNGSRDSARWLQLFDALGEKLSISPEAQS
jgi:alpha-amylase/alpha-mannosidase (GH57 family)